MPIKPRSSTDSERTAGTAQALQSLKNKLLQGTLHIGIYGLGYVGLPLALRFAEVGVRVTGFDIDSNKVELLNSGKSYIERITPAQIQKARQAGFTATTDFAVTTELDAQIICVPTPLDQHHQPDLSFVVNTVESILPRYMYLTPLFTSSLTIQTNLKIRCHVLRGIQQSSDPTHRFADLPVASCFMNTAGPQRICRETGTERFDISLINRRGIAQPHLNDRLLIDKVFQFSRHASSLGK